MAENAVAASAIHEHPLTLDQAAVLIEFDDDDATRAQLIEVATSDPTQFTHAAQRARDERTRAKVKADAESDLTARGYTIIDHEVYYGDSGHTNIRELRTPDGERVNVEDIENIDGRAAYVRVPWNGDAQVVDRKSVV